MTRSRTSRYTPSRATFARTALRAIFASASQPTTQMPDFGLREGMIFRQAADAGVDAARGALTIDGRALRTAGFTLIEVMIVVAIVGILAGVAYPSYVEHVVKSRRATAAACLHDHAQFMERFNALNLRYDRDAAGNAVALPALTCAGDLNSGHTHYSFTLTNVAATTYTINAVPQGSQASKDVKCGTLSLNQAGVRAHSGSGSDRDCWH